MKLKQKHILNYLLIFSGIIVLLNDLILNETPEIVSFGDELGVVLSNLSLAYISSYIFYYVVVVIKERKDKQYIYITVYEWTNHLVGRAYGVYNEIIAASGANHMDYDKQTITKEEYKDLCNKANPNAISKTTFLGTPGNPQKATHGQLIFNNSVSNVKSYSEKVFNYMPFLDSEFINLINKLHSSKFYLLSPSLTFPDGNKDFSVYSESMYEFLEFVRELERFNETVNKNHVNNG